MTKITEGTLTSALLNFWGWDSFNPHFIVAFQVNNGAGFNYSRKLDAIVFDTWPSKGLLMHGLEIKCTKADLRTELQNTNKFADFAPYLDTFSIVAPPGVVDTKILPPQWGYYRSDEEGKSLKTMRKPLMLHTEGSNKEFNRSFMAAFTRALVQRSLSTEVVDEAYKRGKEEAKKAAKDEIMRQKEHYDKLTKALELFEEASGIHIDTWHSARLGEAVNFVLKGGLKAHSSYIGDMKVLGKRLLSMADELDRLNKELNFKNVQ